MRGGAQLTKIINRNQRVFSFLQPFFFVGEIELFKSVARRADAVFRLYMFLLPNNNNNNKKNCQVP
jgi:hypothetical protein